MKLIKQKILYFKEGNSDKVYEVDLCESSNDLFVVNFRFGRRESVLREGTKTVFPVGYDEALVIFDKLVLSKEKKGYSESGVTQEAEPVEVVPVAENTIRDETVLKYLTQGAAGTYTRNWKISKVILRAGVLNLTAAAPSIQSFILSKDEFEQYAAIKTLAYFKDYSVADKVFSVFSEKGLDNKVGRMAAAYLIKAKKNNYHNEILRAAKQKMPSEISSKLGSKTDLLGSLALYYMQEQDINPMTLYYLYLTSFEDTSLKKTLLEFLNNISFKVNTFKSVRYIFRTAEVLNELDFYALIAKKIGVDGPGHNSDYVYSDGQWVWLSDEMKKTNPSVAFSKKTQNYFINAIYKYVYRLSAENVDGYIAVATQFLCQLDNDKDKARQETKYNYDYNFETGNYSRIDEHYPRYSKFSALMFVLHGSTTRFERKKNRWYYTGQFIEPKNYPREEVLAEEWNKRSNEVLHILANSKSEEATLFAFRILKENKHFLDSAPANVLQQLVGNYNAEVVEYILDYLEEKYNQEQPPAALVLAMFKSLNEKGAELAKKWLEKYEKAYCADKSFVSSLLLSGNFKIIAYLKEVYANGVKYSHQFTLNELEELFKVDNSYSMDYLMQVADLIGQEHFVRLFNQVSQDELANLISSDAVTNILFAVNLCKGRKDWFHHLFKDRVDAYINSDDAVLRELGIMILGYFPDSFLRENSQRLSRYYFSEHAEVRTAIQPAIARLVKLDTVFKKNILTQSLKTISNAESYEGVHETVYSLLSKEYELALRSLSVNEVLGLVSSKFEYAQKLGTPLFKQLTKLPSFTIEQLVVIAKSDVKEVRDFLPGYFEKNTARINMELEGALRIFNSDWKDVFDWSFAYFEKHIKPENWTIDLLLYSCDHIKEEVQAFGRKMVTTHFTNDKGLELLLKLQEHPSKGMQFFATNYLANYAKDNPEVTLKLKSFFKTVLFNINEGRSTKTRVFAFLEQEVIKNEQVAQMTIDLLDAILNTNIMTDQSRCIDLLLTISEYYPNLTVPLTVKEI